MIFTLSVRRNEGTILKNKGGKGSGGVFPTPFDQKVNGDDL